MTKMYKKLLFLLMFLLVVQGVAAASIQGNVYSFYLDKQSNAIVTIDTVPKQTMVAKDGSYSFTVDTGSYTITAIYGEGGIIKDSVQETITIKNEGNFVVDLILFPIVEPEEIADLNIEDDVFAPKTTTFDIILFIVAVLGFIFVMFLVYKYTKVLKEVTDEVRKTSQKIEKVEVRGLTKDVLDFIKKEEKTTQKEIRKHFPSSEAKISLVIAELEKKGLVDKIKKGRGNVIVLK